MSEMKKKLVLTVAALFFLTGCVFISLPGVQPLVEKVVGGKGAGKVLLVDISGVISDDDAKNLIGLETSPNITARIKEELTIASSDDDVKAVVLRINSPGGSVTTCDIISHEIKEFKKKRKVPVVAELMDVAASGGYYIAASADRIIAHPTTVTGSIGVIAYNVNASGLMQKIGVTDQTIKSGGKKDIGSPLRPMTEEERKILLSVINGMYDRFIDVVLEGRKGLDREALLKLADGRIYSAPQALDLKLVDSIGYLDDAIEEAKREAGLKEARVVTYSAPKAYKNNIYSSAGPVEPASLNIINLDPGFSKRFGLSFMYVWMP